MNFLKSLRENWILIAFTGSLIMGWTMFSARLSSAEDKIRQLETAYEQLQEIKVDLAVIKEKVGDDNLKDKVKAGVAEVLQTYEINPR